MKIKTVSHRDPIMKNETVTLMDKIRKLQNGNSPINAYKLKILTFNPEPSISGHISALVKSRTLEHSRILSSHVTKFIQIQF